MLVLASWKLLRYLVLGPLVASASPPSLQRRDVLGGAIGLGDIADQAYLVSVTIGNSTVPLRLDTWRSDLLVISDACKTPACDAISGPRYTPGSSFVKLYDGINLIQALEGGESFEDTPEGRVGRDTVTIAGVSASNQVIGVVDNTNATSLYNGAKGNLGLGFPLASLMEYIVIALGNRTSDDDDDDAAAVDYDSLIGNMSDSGPILSRLSQTNAIEQPTFSITLQRDTIDISGTGQLTIGELPSGVDNGSITWVPVRLYDLTRDPDIPPPTSPHEKAYPAFWEIPLDAIYLDGEELTAFEGSSPGNVTALISSTSHYVNGSADVVQTLLKKVSSSKDLSQPTLPCSTPHNLTFQIGGKLFPIDPRDFASPAASGTGTTCIANVRPMDDDLKTDTDQWTWVLGTPFLKSNLVAFYYGNLTHPSVDPPRVGLVSRVPQDAGARLGAAVSQAQSASGKFESTSQAAPMASSLITGAPTATIPGRTPSSVAPSANAARSLSLSLNIGAGGAGSTSGFLTPGRLSILMVAPPLVLRALSLICGVL